MKPSSPLRVERLEDRCVPATFGIPWPDGMHLTLSFAPDGTLIGGTPSTLNAVLDPLGNDAARLEILRAFQTWAVNANLNIGLVADGGQDFAVGGAIEGDPRFGDIRIGARPLGTDVLAVTAPFNLFGTSSGDSILNSSASLSLGGGLNTYDLYTTYLQEAGHAFSLDNSQNPSSVMYEYYLSPRAGLSAGDVASIQSLYGARSPDAYEGTTGNETIATAKQFSGPSLEADITTTSDVDTYRFKVPPPTTSTTISLNAAGLSLLTGRLEVVDSSGQVIASAVATDPTNNDVTLTLTNLVPNQWYYVRVSSASNTVFGVGSYKLQISPSDQNGGNLSVPPPDDQNDTLATATPLANVPTPSGGFSYDVRASFGSDSDVDYYRITTPGTVGTVNLVAAVWGLGATPENPRIDVFDANGNAVAAQVLTNDGGSFVIQVTGAQAGASYYLRLSSATQSVGDYAAAVAFPTAQVTFPHGATGTVSAAVPQASNTMTVAQVQQVHFVLAADGQSGGAVQLTVRDAQGNVVVQAVAAAGGAVSVDAILSAGQYTVQIAAVPNDDGSVPTVAFNLRLIGITDPIDIQPGDTTSSPQGGNPPGSGPPPPPPDSGPTWVVSAILDGFDWF